MTIKDLKINAKNIPMKCLLAFMFICPVYYNNGKYMGFFQNRIEKEEIFQLGATILFSVIILENVYLSAFLIWSAFLYAYFNFPSIGGNYVINIFWGCLIYQMVYMVVNKENYEKVFDAILWFCAANLILIFLQLNNFDTFYTQKLNNGISNAQPVGFMGIKAHMGILFALALPLMARKNTWVALVFFVPIYISECSVAMVGGIAAFLFHLYENEFYMTRKKFLAFLLVFSVAGGLYVWHDSKARMMTNRLNVWKLALKDALVHPLTGWGLDSFRNVGEFKPFLYFSNNVTNEATKFAYDKENNKWIPTKGFQVPYRFEGEKQIPNVSPWDNPHNEYVGLFYEFGLFGLLLLIAFFKNIRRRYFSTGACSAACGFFIALLIVSTGQFPFHVARLAYLIVIMLAIYYKITDEVKNEVENER